MAVDKDIRASIAVTRFGLGARPGEIAAARGDPEAYLTAQIRPEGADRPAGATATSGERINEYVAYRKARATEKRLGVGKTDDGRMANRALRLEAGGDFFARVQLAASHGRGLSRTLDPFWANHFTVSAKKLATVTLVGPSRRRRSGRACSAASKTCWSPRPATRQC